MFKGDDLSVTCLSQSFCNVREFAREVARDHTALGVGFGHAEASLIEILQHIDEGFVVDGLHGLAELVLRE